MSVLKQFSEKELEYDIYQNRLRAIMVQKSLEHERDEAVQKLDKTTQKLDKTTGERDKATEERDKLKKALKEAGIDPDEVLGK